MVLRTGHLPDFERNYLPVTAMDVVICLDLLPYYIQYRQITRREGFFRDLPACSDGRCGADIRITLVSIMGKFATANSVDDKYIVG